ncbi:carbohydrate ABC transporter permease [Paenibacillus rhizophilus]|uniref:Maltose/maltodextrin transport system permease protein n=1 Tax=Paenibacillus rhizophilus TaxID=1850366 RepID=A0A3N9NXW1_9BACL|nr:sugar ABC transporter permease [Paenibacillus rhizophilus]RQW08728.1 sugar ABC transporter permease [Paenibacillus rhizophilus]
MQEFIMERNRSKLTRTYSRTAAVLSALAMGLGQLYNRQYMKGVILLAVHALALYTFIFRLPHAVWGLVTLGETETQLKKVGRLYKQVMGDHSVFLMIEGLVTVFVALIFLWIYVMNIKDSYRTGKMREQGEVPNTFKETVSFVMSYRFPYLILAVPLAGVFFFTIMPIVFMILIAFTNYTAAHTPPKNLLDWTGFEAFKDLFRIKEWSRTFYSVTLWTIIWAIVATLTGYFGGFAVALLVQQKRIRFKSFWRTLFILPYAIPMFVSMLILQNMFNGQFGPVNQYLGLLGIDRIPWLSDPTWAKVTLVIANFWVAFPVSMLMIIGIMSTIPKDMYEAADIDGASSFQKTRLITFPSVMYSMAPLVIMSFVGNMNNFNVIFLLTNGNPINGDFQYAGNTDILITWLYKLSMENGQYNFASVIGIIIFILLSVFAIWNVRRTKAFKEDTSS